jgi:predicted acetyltransferase
MSAPVVPATAADRPVIERLIQLYLHDMTEFNPYAIGRDGLYEYDFLDRFWQHPYLLLSGDELAGFALVIDNCPVTGAAPCRFMAELFVLKQYRRIGLASAACADLIARHPGLWHIGVIERNATAASFWRRFLAPRQATSHHHEFDGERWLVYELRELGPQGPGVLA